MLEALTPNRKSYDYTTWFFKNFGETGNVSSILINRLKELSNRLQKTLDPATIAKITPTAKGLTQAVSKLREHFKSVDYSLIQRLTIN
jgi:hypothetical protein